MRGKVASATLVVVFVLGMAAVHSIAAETVKEDGGAQLAGPRPLAGLIMGNAGRFLVLRSELNISAEQRKMIAAEIKSHKDVVLQSIRGRVTSRYSTHCIWHDRWV
jgi:hypothetical protein